MLNTGGRSLAIRSRIDEWSIPDDGSSWTTSNPKQRRNTNNDVTPRDELKSSEIYFIL